MRKVFFILSVLFSIIVNAQEPITITKFLGIPIDGTKSNFIFELQKKGFRYHEEFGGYLTGEFNGYNVNIYLATNRNKMYRVMVADANTQSATAIKRRYNALCEQFENNPKYMNVSVNSNVIPEDEDVSYEMYKKEDKYVAQFIQKPDADIYNAEYNIFREEMYKILSDSIYENIQKTLKDSTEEFIYKLVDTYEPIYIINNYEDNLVTMKISKINGEYEIIIYYDNNKNKAHGEDL